ncbi:MFS transporter [Sphingomonas histidinilytica]|jgi:AAHS family 4-hydroxybenzoate transporter-like MFS transporter|uniref:MFS transporter, AAHS family, 4-hydroxybenzoate transporter n=1 Tax=Rhizorhabdus histidinilytica TaxID=439228 RepID=A0A1T5G2K6_9SPHN|nr:MFS transporter [Rhizorhabdus histidinilytica]MBO9378378.1 MFS transporter [Rhizorhabdus histidinilytica]QEH81541.1 MFS transporter [Sphingomonas sp. C8-2]SKC02539.1 MFS transporter, AAHS family, 4-hydroxybenzoate transporter [Rhizorhabdus histidinilytica]
MAQSDEAARTGPIDIESFLDGVQFSPFHFRVMLIGALVMMVDGFDLGVLSWVLPKVSDDFGVTRTSLTWVLSTQQAGMVLGAYLIAPIADQIGRKRLLLLCLLAVSASCFVTIFVNSVLALAICRLVTGMFASAVIANMVALASELAPARRRSTMVTMVLAGSMPGAILGSAMQAFLLNQHGWHIAFWIGAGLPLLLLPVMLFFLPESPKFLAARNPSDPRLLRTLEALAPGQGTIELAPPQARTAKGGSVALVRELFAPGLALPTILLWLAFISSFGFISAALWKTTVFHDLIGLDWKQVGITTALGTGFGAVGMVTIGMMIDRFGFRAIVPTYFVIASMAAVGMALFAPGWGMYVALAINATMQHAAHAGLASIASTLYPTRNRATGVGWAYGAGRAASIVGPMYGALALEHHWGALGYFFLLAAPLASAGIVIWLLLTVKPLARVGHVAGH